MKSINEGIPLLSILGRNASITPTRDIIFLCNSTVNISFPNLLHHLLIWCFHNRRVLLVCFILSHIKCPSLLIITSFKV